MKTNFLSTGSNILLYCLLICSRAMCAVLAANTYRKMTQVILKLVFSNPFYTKKKRQNFKARFSYNKYLVIGELQMRKPFPFFLLQYFDSGCHSDGMNN